MLSRKERQVFRKERGDGNEKAQEKSISLRKRNWFWNDPHWMIAVHRL
jgi:hypothetical protein